MNTLRIVQAVLIGLLLVGVLLGDIVNFLPSAEFSELFYFGVLVLIASWVYLLWKSGWMEQLNGVASRGLLAVLVVPLGSYFSLMAVAYPVPSVISMLIGEPSMEEVVVESKEEHRSIRRCDYGLQFQGRSSLPTRDDLCVSEHGYGTVEAGDVLVVEGQKSWFGVRVVAWSVKR